MSLDWLGLVSDGWFGHGCSYRYDGGRDLACVGQGIFRLCVDQRE
jgi:hypothetical protein